MRDYQHTQTGYATLALIGSSSLALVAIVLAGDVGQEALALGLVPLTRRSIRRLRGGSRS